MNTVVRLCALLGLVAVVGTCSAANPKVGDVVWAEWKPNMWYHGKVAKSDKDGFHIDYDDGDKSIVKGGQIAIDTVPGTKDVKVGTAVLAKFQGGDFYPGKIDRITKDGVYHIQFDDGDTDSVKIDDLRVINK